MVLSVESKPAQDFNGAVEGEFNRLSGELVGNRLEEFVNSDLLQFNDEFQRPEHRRPEIEYGRKK